MVVDTVFTGQCVAGRGGNSAGLHNNCQIIFPDPAPAPVDRTAPHSQHLARHSLCRPIPQLWLPPPGAAPAAARAGGRPGRNERIMTNPVVVAIITMNYNLIRTARAGQVPHCRLSSPVNTSFLIVGNRPGSYGRQLWTGGGYLISCSCSGKLCTG